MASTGCAFPPVPPSLTEHIAPRPSRAALSGADGPAPSRILHKGGGAPHIIEEVVPSVARQGFAVIINVPREALGVIPSGPVPPRLARPGGPLVRPDPSAVHHLRHRPTSSDSRGLALPNTCTPDTMTRSRSARRSGTTSVSCEHCNKEIRNVDQLLLLTSTDSTPESCAAVTIHEDCADAFLKTHPGSWQRYAGCSSSASWFLPMMVRWPGSRSTQP